MLPGISIKYKVVIVLFLMVILPNATTLYLIEAGHDEELSRFLSALLALSFGLLIPMSGAFAYFIVLKDIRVINRWCMNVKEGREGLYFDLPNEEEDEHEMIKLRRNMNWMLRTVSNRSRFLQSQLSEIRESSEEFRELSFRDALTDLYNRRFFDLKIQELAASIEKEPAFTAQRNRPSKKPGFSLVWIDADHFKQVNDTLGHQAGDELLIKLAGIINTSIREGTDFPFRLGGDEFCIIISDSCLKGVTRTAERIRGRYMKNAIGNSTLSIGVALFAYRKNIEKDIRKVVKAADQAVYKAKNDGGNKVVIAERDCFGQSSELCSRGIADHS